MRRNIGLVFQDPTLDGYLTAEQNLRLHAELYGVQTDLVAPRMQQVLRWSACGSARTRSWARSRAACAGGSRSRAA